jgi:hypothetical protein
MLRAMDRPPPPPRNAVPPRRTAGAGRACGPCDLCCRLPSIDWAEYPELRKPPDAPCLHLDVGVGCRIHPDRPIHCASFQCLWLMGFGPDELRPDTIGGFFDASDDGSLFLLTDRAKRDPRTNPTVRSFIEEWTRKRRARLRVYRAGVEVKEPREGREGAAGATPTPRRAERRGGRGA